ncbi:DEAD/DEAH box helicase [Shouchella patagoniensis]|uniref:DEAD/DEAH box helicase n=1 Tax=Shouchella patagoniensis TaxID=228576 RepID=UPI000994F0A5|nr:DEAD/DEAH box helicase [Shouchella patagoniensis]
MTKKTFSSYPLDASIQRALSLLHYTNPTDIQQQVLPILLENGRKDLIAQSQTGSGKTAAYGIPLCEKANWEENKPQALVLTPTRELAEQVRGDLTAIGRFKRLQVRAVYGKQSYERQKLGLKQKNHIVVGTPGRVLDHLQKGTLPVEKLQYVVIDEADELFNKGFLDQVTDILDLLPTKHVTMLFSATFPPEIKKLINVYLQEPVVIKGESAVELPATTSHAVMITKRKKEQLLVDVLAHEKPESALVFCETQEEVDRVFRAVQKEIPRSGKLHGALRQEERFAVMDAFKSGKIRYLIATNLAARGIDVAQMEMVIQMNVPPVAEEYVHRTGRTGRAGAKGKSLLFVHADEAERLPELEEAIGYSLESQSEPKISPAVRKTFRELRSNANAQSDSKQAVNHGIMKLYFNGGKQKKLRAGDFVGTITRLQNVSADDIGIITVEKTSTFIEILNGKGTLVLEQMRKTPVKGKLLKVHQAKK